MDSNDGLPDANTALVLLCGLPGSGKTTLANTLSSFLVDTHSAEVHSLCVDEEYEVQKPRTEEFDPATWKNSRKVCTDMARQILGESLQPGQMRRVVIIDDNMHYSSMRREFYRLARDCRCTFIQIYVSCPVNVCLGRDEMRQGMAHVGREVICRMERVFDVPCPRVNSWESTTVNVDSCSIDFRVQPHVSRIWDSLLDVWGKPPPMVEIVSEQEILERKSAGQAKNAQSLVHSFDLWSRSLLTETMEGLEMKGTVNGSKRELGKVLNKKRRTALNVLKEQIQKEEVHCTFSLLQRQFQVDCKALSASPPQKSL